MTQDHYFSDDPQSPSERKVINARLRGEVWSFITDRGTFSPEHVDPGSKLLIECLELPLGARVLDIGAGWGPIGLVAAKLIGPEGRATLVEVNARAAGLARENAVKLGLDNVDVITTGDLAALELPPQDVVLTNPPVRAGWKVVMPLIDAGAAKLRPGGTMWLVGYKHLGVESLSKRLATAVGGPVTVVKRQGGYRVLAATLEAGGA